jgi:diguanylate cyclase (GGDEF)-like protein
MSAEKTLLTNVLLLADKADTALDWANSLKNVARTWFSWQEVPGDVEIRVVLTDLPETDLATLRTCQTDKPGESSPSWAAIGNRVGWADACLPADVSPRELRLACELLGQIARLRAQRDSASRAVHESRLLAETDPLTGLANRRVWDAQLAGGGTGAQPSTRCVAILDLDSFKQINDQGGLAEGDRVLKRMAEALAGCLRKGDSVARLGGDEFGVMLDGADHAAASKVLERLRATVAEVSAHEGFGPLTVSIGFAVGGAPLPELLAIAERGMRQAKLSGGNRVCSGSRDAQ